MKIKQVTEVDITSDNGNRIWFDHDQDCCEHNYADFKQIDDLAYEWDFDEDLKFESCPHSGFRFGNEGRMVFVPNRMKWDFDRDQFCEAFKEVFPGDYSVQIQILCEQVTPIYNFILFKCADEYGILHIETGLYVRWYKHLGRANATNIPNGDLFLLKLFLLELRQETDGHIGIDTGFPEWEED